MEMNSPYSFGRFVIALALIFIMFTLGDISKDIKRIADAIEAHK
jgi:hypothetical protein